MLRMALRVRHGAACDAVERKTGNKIEVVQQRILEVLEDRDDVRH